MVEVLFQFSDGEQSASFTDEQWALVERAAALAGETIEQFLTSAIEHYVIENYPVMITEEP